MTEPSLPDVDSSNIIPRVIHQTFPGKQLPADLAANVDKLKDMNLGWEHRLYDDTDIERIIAVDYGDDMLRLYRSIDPSYGAARADLFRYLLIYRYGGVYLDIKSSTTRPLDDLLDGAPGYILCQWDNGPAGSHRHWGLHRELEGVAGGELQQWHVIAPAGHRFLRAVIERVSANIGIYRPWRDGVGRDAVLRATGPVAYTKAILPLLEGDDFRLVGSERDAGLLWSILPGESHRNLFTTHYATNFRPVIIPSPVQRPLAVAHGLYRSLRSRMGIVKRQLMRPRD